jgi:hypothetical protein
MTLDTRHGLTIAVREHLLSGQPITRMEAIVLYGVANLPDVIKELRRQGWIIKSRTITYAAAVNRLNKHASLRPPKNLPVREIRFTEYWVSK